MIPKTEDINIYQNVVKIPVDVETYIEPSPHDDTTSATSSNACLTSRFNDYEYSDDSSSNCDSIDTTNDVGIISSSELLRKKLEKLRSKKDKSIVRLANQLKVCTDQSDAKEIKMRQMDQTINELEDAMHKYQKKVSIDRERITNACRDTEERLEECECEVSRLQQQVIDVNEQIEALRSQVDSLTSTATCANDRDSTRIRINGISNVFDCLKCRKSRLRAGLVVAGISVAIAAIKFYTVSLSKTTSARSNGGGLSK